MIRLCKVTVKYKEEIIEECDLSFPSGKVTLITGESGAGKTSLLYRIGLISQADDFVYYVNDRLIKGDKEKEKLRNINFGYVLQDSMLFHQYDAIENMRLYASLAGYEYSEEEYRNLLSSVHLTIDPHQQIETLSGGERQRLAIACALCKQPDVLILDEITSSLDKENEIHMFRILQWLAHEKKKCVILASHSKYAHQYADQIYYIENKKIRCNYPPSKDKSVVWKQEQNPLHFKFYRNYIAYFLKKYKKLNRMIFLVMTMGFFLSQLALGLFQLYADESIKDFSELYEPKLLLTNTYGNEHMDEAFHVFREEAQKILDEVDHIFEEVPMISAQIMLNGVPVWILPYFEGDAYHTKIDQSYGDEGILLSKEAYDLINQENRQDSIVTDILLQEMKENEQKQYKIPVDLKIQGVFKQNVTSPYVHTKAFVYMKYDQLRQLYEVNASSKQFVGKILLFQNYDDLRQVEKELAEKPIGVNTDFCDIDAIIEILSSIRLVKMMCMGILLILFTAMFTAFQMNYLYQRKTEFALLIINGMIKSHLQRLLSMEALFKFFVSFVFATIFSIMLSFLMYLGFHIKFGSIQIIIIVFFTGFGACIILSRVLSRIYIRKLIPETILRN